MKNTIQSLIKNIFKSLLEDLEILKENKNATQNQVTQLLQILASGIQQEPFIESFMQACSLLTEKDKQKLFDQLYQICEKTLNEQAIDPSYSSRLLLAILLNQVKSAKKIVEGHHLLYDALDYAAKYGTTTMVNSLLVPNPLSEKKIYKLLSCAIIKNNNRAITAFISYMKKKKIPLIVGSTHTLKVNDATYQLNKKTPLIYWAALRKKSSIMLELLKDQNIDLLRLQYKNKRNENLLHIVTQTWTKIECNQEEDGIQNSGEQYQKEFLKEKRKGLEEVIPALLTQLPVEMIHAKNKDGMTPLHQAYQANLLKIGGSLYSQFSSALANKQLVHYINIRTQEREYHGCRWFNQYILQSYTREKKCLAAEALKKFILLSISQCDTEVSISSLNEHAGALTQGRLGKITQALLPHYYEELVREAKEPLVTEAKKRS